MSVFYHLRDANPNISEEAFNKILKDNKDITNDATELSVTFKRINQVNENDTRKNKALITIPGANVASPR